MYSVIFIQGEVHIIRHMDREISIVNKDKREDNIYSINGRRGAELSFRDPNAFIINLTNFQVNENNILTLSRNGGGKKKKKNFSDGSTCKIYFRKDRQITVKDSPRAR